MRKLSKYILILIVFGLFLGMYALNASRSVFYAYMAETAVVQAAADTTPKPRYPVSKTVPENYEDLTTPHPVDLRSPENVKSEVEYDPQTNRYLLKTKVGDMEVVTPFSMSLEEYKNYSAQQSLNAYFRQKNAELVQKGDSTKPFSPFEMQFDLGPAEKIFGKGGVRVETQGSAEIIMGVKHNTTGNPTMSERARSQTLFDFDSQINLNVNAKVGEKIDFGLNYNTEATFDFDSKRLKLAYQGKEDEILKLLEAGNVSMNTSNSLIRGGAALFGIKTELQFGKLRVGAILSQQESESKSVSSRGGVQTTPFEISVDQYDENRYFFLAHYFYNTYDTAMTSLPFIKSGVSINRMEVWVTNKRGKNDEVRNMVAFSDLAEFLADDIGNDKLVQPTQGGVNLPYNNANNLYNDLKNKYTDARDINKVTQTLDAAGFVGGEDYEKIENARKLSPSEYTFNQQLGYIALKTALQTDEVLGVAFEYTYQGKVYQVGEFSADNSTNSNQNIYLKLLKGTVLSPSSAYWKLMMKNVYSLGAYSLQKDKFRLDIMYQSDTTGTYVNYLTEGDIANQNLLSVMNLDRLDSRENPYPDGFFDYVEGYTVSSQNGRIIFPVVEPFGSHLAKKINDSIIAKKYVFQELYDTTLTVAKQIAEKNKFRLKGEYRASSGSEIQLGAMNVAPGSVRVTANGAPLTEGSDYTVNYSNGTVTIINPSLLDSNTPISVSLENQSNYGMQRKTMMGLDLNYEFSKDFNFGATIMHLRETPVTAKTNIGEESVRNTLWGFNTAFRTESQWLTNLVDKLPLLDLTAPSQITFNAEFAHLIPGHYESEYGGKYSYVDDFERTKITHDLRTPYSWFLSATPFDPGKEPLFKEASLVNNVEYGKNRALLAWYTIDPLFTRKNSSLTPEHIKNDKDQLSNHYVREVTEYELYPNKELVTGEPVTIQVLNLAYYPKERGPYNIVADFDQDGNLNNPNERWGGIYRKTMDNPDFESSNYEYIEFWLMDPFIYNPDSPGGDFYINLGEVSEDVLKDERKFAESAMPINGDTTQMETTNWGMVPKRQTMVYAFDNTKGTRKYQDVGLNGLRTEQEFEHASYAKYLNDLNISSDTRRLWQQDPFSPLNDPAGDNYHYYRGSDYDRAQTSILDRYKRFNGLEGNSSEQDASGDNFSTSSYKTTPDVEDANQDFTMNENERYFQYKIHLDKKTLDAGGGYVTNIHKAEVTLRNGNREQVTWYQFKVPLKEPTQTIGNIKDLKSIRYMRMFLTNFADSVILRFATLELVRGEWRAYTQDLYDPNRPPNINAIINVAAVNLEENADRQPVNYVMPPGVNRVIDPGQPQIRQENEQALSMRIDNLAQGDARAIYKNTNLDMRQYKRIQMFTHAEKVLNDVTNLQNNELSVFLRLGSDYKNNYYEYEIPLKLTPAGTYNTYDSQDQATVWPSENMFDFPFELLTDLKLERNREKRKGASGVSFSTPYSTYDPEKPINKVTVLGNPSLAEVKTIMIGVRNNSTGQKSTTVWVNELRLTEFNEDGGWAANANLNIALSDLGSINLGGRVETAGFGSLDQGVMERSIDDYYQYNVSANVELGKLFPKEKVSAPLYYAYGEQVISPKYNPLDQDILLKDALDNAGSSAEKDSISSLAQTKVITKSFNLSNIRVNVTSKNPMPWDPSNLSLAYSYSESNTQNPTTEYERTTDRRGSLTYTYSPYAKPWQPFKNIKSKSGSAKFAKEFGIGYLPANLSFQSGMSRTYYEMRLRDLNSIDGTNHINPSFRQEFYWDRDFRINWNLTKNLNFSLETGTRAIIEEPHVQVNKKLNPDQYEMWKDSVWQSIQNFGTPLDYAQAFKATYNLPMKLIPVLDWTTAGATYNATYNWDRGATVLSADEEIGNTIRNQRQMDFTTGLQFVNLYKKSDFLKKVEQKFVLKRPTAASRRAAATKTAAPKPEPKKFERDIQLNMDSATVITHNLKSKKVRVSAKDADGKRYELKYKSVNENQIRITNKDSVSLKLTVLPGPKLDDETWYKVAQVTARGLMMVRSVNVTYSLTDGMMLPGFRPDVGAAFGQGSTPFGYAPGVDFAFGLTGRSYIDKADDNGWLLNDTTSNINPAMFNHSENLNIKATLEPIVGLKIDLTANRLSTQTTNIQYMYDGVPDQYSGNFSMTTIAIGTAMESSKAANGYRSAAFDNFLENRKTIAARLQRQYSGVTYPDAGFISETSPSYAGKSYGDPSLVNEPVNLNNSDVLIPAFIAAYTGKDASKTDITAFPSLKSLLPNWNISYEGLVQLDMINKHFKAFVLRHNYTCVYSVGSFSSFLNWVSAPEDDGLGFVMDVLTDNPSPSSPYDISLASITESFNPLLGFDATFLNNMTIRADYKNVRNVNLNVSSYQIVETKTNEMIIGVGYKITEFNKVLKMRHSGAKNFSNDLTLRGDVSYRKMHSLIRKIEDGFTQPTSGTVTTTIKLSADYNLSKALTFRAFFNKDINKPLVSSSAYPSSNASFGVSLRMNLTR